MRRLRHGCAATVTRRTALPGQGTLTPIRFVPTAGYWLKNVSACGGN